jgi:hypothetical protein
MGHITAHDAHGGHPDEQCDLCSRLGSPYNDTLDYEDSGTFHRSSRWQKSYENSTAATDFRRRKTKIRWLLQNEQKEDKNINELEQSDNNNNNNNNKNQCITVSCSAKNSSSQPSPSQSYQKHHSVSQPIISTPYLFHLLVLVLLTFAHCADACSSRSTPKPRAPSHSAMRPNITFQTYACPPAYAAWYCLNGATCFTVKIADSILYNCECSDGYMGQRCEFKDLDGTYLPTRERLLMSMGLLGKSSKAGPVFLAVFFIILAAAIVSVIVTRTRSRAKKARILTQSNVDMSHIDVLPTRSNPVLSSGSSSSISGSGYCSSTDLTVLGQSISYTLSQQRYPYLADYQGAELRSIHRHDSTNRMVSSRIPAAKNLTYYSTTC